MSLLKKTVHGNGLRVERGLGALFDSLPKLNNFMPTTKCPSKPDIQFFLEFFGKLNPTHVGACYPIKQLVNI